jgi:hypothetical protein
MFASLRSSSHASGADGAARRQDQHFARQLFLDPPSAACGFNGEIWEPFGELISG